ncbi:hypothetical protein T492DRAFT_940427 [Pavlovales sp. CCMP2436]|nr:hypothetical protein T492DRAFT_940427 [Pavlovales sp. CCMP2436]
MSVIEHHLLNHAEPLIHVYFYTDRQRRRTFPDRLPRPRHALRVYRAGRVADVQAQDVSPILPGQRRLPCRPGGRQERKTLLQVFFLIAFSSFFLQVRRAAGAEKPTTGEALGSFMYIYIYSGSAWFNRCCSLTDLFLYVLS